MINFIKPKLETFGLDISDSSLKAARVKKSRKGIFLSSFAMVDIEPGVVVNGMVENESALALAIVSLTKKLRAGTGYVSIALSEERSFLKVIRMPKMDERDLKGAVSYEAENHLPLPSGSVYLDFELIGQSRDDDGMEVLVVALPREVSDSCASAVEAAGLFPVFMETESLAMVRSLTDRDDRKGPILIADIGESKTGFIILSGGAIRFAGSVQISSDSFTKEIIDRKGVNRSEAEMIKIEKGVCEETLEEIINDLARSIRHHLDYCHSRVAHDCDFDSISRVLLCGGGANLKGLPEKLSSMTNSEVRLADPFLNLSRKPKNLSLEEGLKYSVVIGSALREFNQ